jgi:hypothetical protein
MQEERVRYRRGATLAAVIAGAVVFSSTTITQATATTTAPTAFVTGFTPTTVRNDFSGQVGMRISVGASDISAGALGRSVLTGNAQSHRLSLQDAAGTVLATASVNLSGLPAGTFAYGSLASPVVLRAGASYVVLSDEVAGGDGWYDYSSQPVAGVGGQVTGAAYAVAGGSVVVGASAAQAYGVVNLQFSGSSSPVSTTTSTTVAGTTSTTAVAGAAPNTNLTDSAIRRALQKGGVIRLPAGTVNIKAPLRVTKSGTKLIGAGSGATILRMAFGPTAFGPLIALPAEWSKDFGNNPPPASMRVSNVEIANLAIDGAREGNPNTYGGTQASTLRFGIQSTISTNTWLHNLHIYDVAGDAIGFGNGTGVNVNPLVEDVLIERSGRNGMHLGSSDGAVIRRVQILDTPGVYWANAGAGNGLDIEVEGADPRVTNTLIENSVFERPTNPGFAGYGIQITRAYGPVDGVTIRGNEFRNHQLGVLVSTASNVVIENNVFNTSPIGENNVTGGGIGLMSAGPGYGSSAVIRFNQFNFDPWQWFADSMVSVTGPGDWRVEDNVMYGATQVFRAYGDTPSTIQSARNQYRPLNNGPLFVAVDPSIQTFTDTGSVRVG